MVRGTSRYSPEREHRFSWTGCRIFLECVKKNIAKQRWYWETGEERGYWTATCSGVSSMVQGTSRYSHPPRLVHAALAGKF